MFMALLSPREDGQDEVVCIVGRPIEQCLDVVEGVLFEFQRLKTIALFIMHGIKICVMSVLCKMYEDYICLGPYLLVIHH